MFVTRCRLVKIPKEKIELIRSRASGPGGQNINASHSRVQLKFDLSSADWLSAEIKTELSRTFGKSVVVSCQDSRSWIDNEKTAFSQLQHSIDSTEQRLNEPQQGFESFQDYIQSVRTDKQIESYKKRQRDSKRRTSLDRERRREPD